jgi:B12-binding domain/radical SAM domain protein
LPAGTRVLAYSFGTPELEDVAREIRTLRQEGKSFIMVAGGAHSSADPQGTLAAGFDVVFVGEGESTFPEFFHDLVADRALKRRVRKATSRFDLDSAVHVEPSLGLFPFPEISRGCPHACAYCQTSNLFGRRARHRSPEVVAAGVEQAVRAGFVRFRFLTPNGFGYGGGGPAKRRAALGELFEACQRAGAREFMLGYYPSEVRPEYIHPELLDLVKKQCHNRVVQLGAQSGSDRVLDLMHRGHSVEQARRGVSLVHEAGLDPLVDVLFGFPGEEWEDRLATLDLIEWCLEYPRARIHTHVYLPLPGAAAWPAPAEKLEPRIVARLERLHGSGRLGGEWKEQAEAGKTILRWREEGLIRV